MQKTPFALVLVGGLAACSQPQGVGFTYGPGPGAAGATSANTRTEVSLAGYAPAPRHAAQSREIGRNGTPVDIDSAARLAVDVAPVSSGSGNLAMTAGQAAYFVRQVTVDGYDFAVLEPGSGARAAASELSQAAAVFTGCLATGQAWTFGNASVSALDCS